MNDSDFIRPSTPARMPRSPIPFERRVKVAEAFARFHLRPGDELISLHAIAARARAWAEECGLPTPPSRACKHGLTRAGLTQQTVISGRGYCVRASWRAPK